MSIATTNGDGGQTGLYTGERVWKDDLRVDAYGTLDELDAHLGEARHAIHDIELRRLLTGIQKDLYRIMGQLASKSSPYDEPLTQGEVDNLASLVHDYENNVNLQGFVLPGSTPASAKLDICRTVARRAERRIVSLSRQEDVPTLILQYVNRLSDLFFIVARWIERREDAITYIK